MAKVKIGLLRAAHKHLSEVLGDFDAQRTPDAGEDDVAGKVKDPNGPGMVAGHVKDPAKPAQDAAITDAMRAALRAELDAAATVPMSQAIPGFDRLKASNLRGLMDCVADPSRK